MRKLLKYIFLCLISLTIVFCSSPVSAATYADTLRIGIYYGSASVSTMTLTSDNGFSVGLFNSDRAFVPVLSSSARQITVSPNLIDGATSYHVDYSRHDSPQSVQTAVETLQAQGMEVFPAYINSKYHVLGGLYKNNNDALWAAENLAVKGTPIVLSEKSVKAFDGNGKLLFVTDDNNYGISVYPSNFENSDSLLTISGGAGGTYRGGFESRSLDVGALTVVNTIPVEAYLYSVVCREMSPSWEVEALKAQAVCARNFALGRINYHSKYGFDVCRTVCCQAYSTTADNSKSVHTAVDETRGELLFWENSLVQAVYSSSMGAYTESVENVWGSKFPYLVSVENPYEDTENVYNGKWTKKLTLSRATEIMDSRGYNIGDVTDIKVLQTTPAGYVLKLQVSGTKGSKVFERESCRLIFSEATYSQKYTISKGGQPIYPTVSISNGKATTTVSTSGISVLGGDNNITNFKNGFYSFDGKTNLPIKPTYTNGDPNTITFSGEGWGHGVGMSQYGAKGMAAAGFTYDKILTHFYTGTHIEKVY